MDFCDDIDDWIERAKEAGVRKIINVGTSIEASKKSVEIAEKYSENGSRIKFGMTKEDDFQIFASVGIHPQDGKGDVKKFGSLLHCFETLKQIAESSKKVVAVGETGLDYYLKTTDPSTHSMNSGQANSGQTARQLTTDKEREFQRKLFTEQIKLARELNLPILVHCRNAWDEIFEIISNEHDSHPEFISGTKKKIPKQNQIPKPIRVDKIRQVRDDMVRNDRGGVRGLFHSWTGDWEAAKKALDLGFYISFSGIVTFKNAPKVAEVAKKVPLDRMLVETDSPFLSPEPYRGMENEPKNVIITAQFLAKLRDIPLDTIEDATSRNTQRLFNIQ
ncbi:TatD family hydrolase [Candidatus Curtissbacteria bacterium]|nr:TatD family hydrolase [Candidatus Curtissbacteria bacterium]